VTKEQITTEKTLEESFKDINKQVLETKYTLNLGQLLWVIHDIKHDILNLIPSKPNVQESIVVAITIYHQMAMMHVQIRFFFIKDVFIDGGFGVNIITEKLKVQLNPSKPNPTPYNLRMAIGAILTLNLTCKIDQPIMYSSRSFNYVEKNYNTT
jgi:hypothetical protein